MKMSKNFNEGEVPVKKIKSQSAEWKSLGHSGTFNYDTGCVEQQQNTAQGPNKCQEEYVLTITSLLSS